MIWDKGSYRRADPDTSVDAALETDASRLQRKVLEVLAHGDFTTEEIATYSGETLQSITPRMVPLEEKGLIARTTKRRPGASGRARIVWRLATYFDI